MKPVANIYSDGGVLGASRSDIGGTWSVVLTDEDDELIREISGAVTTGWTGPGPWFSHHDRETGVDMLLTDLPSITNNITEFLAMHIGLAHVGDGAWHGHTEFTHPDLCYRLDRPDGVPPCPPVTIHCDSEITIGRFRDGWKTTGIPPGWVISQRKRLNQWGKLRYVHLDGHPTKSELEQGHCDPEYRTRRKGKPHDGPHPVSRWNARADELCSQAKVVLTRDKIASAVQSIRQAAHLEEAS